MQRTTKKLMIALLATALTLLLAGQVLAAVGDTEAGTTISNTATVSFTIGGGSPPAVTGSYNFVVDHKIRPVVANVSGATVVPSGTGYALQFTVTNDGNTPAASTLEMLLEAVAGTADFAMSNIEIWQETNTTAGFSADDANLTASPYITLARDTSTTIYIVADAAAGALQTQTSNYHLRATATDGSQVVLQEDQAGANLNSNDADTSEAVFADDASASGLAGDVATDGMHSDQGTYTANWTDLGVVKTATDGGSGYHLPGDTITYSITVTNSDGTNNATGVTISDPVPANTTYSAGTLDCTGLTGSAAEVFDSSAAWVAEGTETPPVSDVRCDGGSITAGGGTGVLSFDVTIN